MPFPRALLATAAAAAAAAALPAGASATVLPQGFAESTIAHRLIEATDHAWTPDGRLLIAEKRGLVTAVGPGGQRALVLDISDHVVNLRDRGLTGIAVDSEFEANGYLYLLYTYEADPSDPTAPQVWRLTRVELLPDGTVADPADPETVVLGRVGTAPCPPPDDASDCIPADTRFHGAGTVRSDPADGTLWVGFGDDTVFDVPDQHAFRTYDERSYTGKIVHVDRQGRGLPNHPFCSADADLDHVCTKIHAKGFRNPFRFHLRPGGPIVGDVGSRSREEIDLAAAGGNYGWPCYEGSERTAEYADHPDCASEYAREGTPEAAIPPVYEYSHQGGQASITGGPVYDGGDFPSAYTGGVFFGDFVKGTLELLRLDESDAFAGVDPFARSLGGPVDIEIGPGGVLTYVDIRYGAVRAIAHPPAGWTGGGLELEGCVGEAVPGCAGGAEPGALDGLNGLAIDADGSNLYAAAIGSGTLSHFARARSGEVEFLGCVSATVPGCDAIGADALGGAHTVALSPDGRSAYTASDSTGTVEHFELDPETGAPEFVDCFGRDRAGCAQSPIAAIRGAHTATVSPDGAQVYVAATAGDALVAFARDPATGSLAFTGCHSAVATNCSGLGGADAVDGPHDAKLAPDGQDLYVPGYVSDNIARFRRSETGALAFAGCIGQPAAGCADLGPVDALDGAHGIALSGDGGDLYAASGLSGTVAHFRRDATSGELAFEGCIGRGAAGCAPFAGNALEGAHWVTVGPDGRGVYVASREGAAVTRFDRDPASGALAYRGCVAQGSAGCLNLSPVEALGGEVDWVEWSPDGSSLYTTSFLDGTLARFRLASPGAPPAPPAAGRQPSTAAVRVKIRRLEIAPRSGRITVAGRVRSSQPPCAAAARVRLLRPRPGADPVEAKRKADPRGRFRIKLGPEPTGRLYAQVRARTATAGTRCGGDRSRALRIRSRLPANAAG